MDFLSLISAMDIVCDIGGTNMRVAAIVGCQIAQVHKVRTPALPGEGIAQFTLLAKECAAGGRIDRVVGCIAGNIDNGTLSGAHNLHEWNGINIVDELSKALDARVDLVNDAALVGLGEATVGAGKGARSIAYVTVSTGVGGALIANDKIVASEWVGGIKVRGTNLEDLVSGTAVRKRLGVEPKDLSDLNARMALADDLAEGLSDVVKRWLPEVIVLGGSMIVGQNPIPVDRVQERLQELLAVESMNCPTLKPAGLEDMGGLHGALVRLMQLNS